jgi:hypothetical protein
MDLGRIAAVPGLRDQGGSPGCATAAARPSRGVPATQRHSAARSSRRDPEARNPPALAPRERRSLRRSPRPEASCGAGPPPERSAGPGSPGLRRRPPVPHGGPPRPPPGPGHPGLLYGRLLRLLCAHRVEGGDERGEAPSGSGTSARRPALAGQTPGTMGNAAPGLGARHPPVGIAALRLSGRFPVSFWTGIFQVTTAP